MEIAMINTESEYDYWAYYYVGEINEINENYKYAREMYRKCIKVNPSFLDAYFSLGKLLHKNNEFNKQIDLYKEAMFFNADSGIIYYKLGEVYYGLKEFDKAIEYLNTSLERGYQSKLLFKKLSDSYIRKEFNNKGIEILNYALGYFDDDYIYITLAELLKDAKEYDEAIDICKKGIDFNPDNNDLNIMLGQIYYFKLLYKESEEELINALKKDSTSAEIYFYLGLISERREQERSAIKYFKRTLQFDTDTTSLYNIRANQFIKKIEK